jgi:hypothetical protein
MHLVVSDRIRIANKKKAGVCVVNRDGETEKKKALNPGRTQGCILQRYFSEREPELLLRFCNPQPSGSGAAELIHIADFKDISSPGKQGFIT